MSTQDTTTGAAATAAAPVLAAVGLTKRFAGVTALSGVDFELHEGEVHGLVGENGAGKSTLIKLLTGVYAPSEGEVRLRGEPVTFRHPYEAQDVGISTIYQEINLVPLLSIARNLFLGREPRRFGILDVRRMESVTGEVLARFGLHVDPGRPLGSLGVGSQQMVAIARAMEIDAKVVVMDEPTSSLEGREVETLMGVIDGLREAGVAVLYVSHRLGELFRICQRITVLRDGELVHTGEVSELDRRRLVSLMIGRELASDTETTSFGGPRESQGQRMLEADGLQRRHELDDVSFTVAAGEVLGLAGLLGAGRSETLKVIAGAAAPDSGEVRVDGDAVRPGSEAAAIRAGVALLTEDRKAEGIVPDLSIRDNIVLTCLPRVSRRGVIDRDERDKLVTELMSRLRVKASGPEQKVGELSGGNQQKVLLARCLAAQPRVLLMDEPTRGIDVGAKAEIQTLIDGLAAEGLSVVLVSSELEEVVEGSDRVLVLREGSVIATVDAEGLTVDDVLALLSEERVAGQDAA